MFKDYNLKFLTKYRSFPIPPKAKENQLKNLNAIYLSNDFFTIN